MFGEFTGATLKPGTSLKLLGLIIALGAKRMPRFQLSSVFVAD
jgi:hypothetical protein